MSGRDYRERSPSREPSRDHSRRDDHSRDYRQQSYDDNRRAQYGSYNRGESESRGRGSASGYSSGTYGSDRRGSHPSTGSSGEKLPDLPDIVPVPKNGARLDLALRPSAGTVGRPIEVSVNHFEIQTLPVVKIYQYNVHMMVPVSSQRRGSEKVSAMQQAKVLLKAQQLWGANFVFDNIALGWSTDLLMPISETRTTRLDLDGHTKEKHNQVEVSVRNTGTLNIRKFVHHLMSSNSSGVMSDDSAVEDVFKALNAVYRQDPASRFITRPKSTAFFQRSPSLSLTLQSTGGILEALRGAYQAVSYSFGRLCLNVDVVCSAFYTPDLCVIDVAKAMAGISPRQNNDDFCSTPMFRQGCERLVGLFFVVRHLNTVRNAKKMRIQSLSSEGARTTTFEELDLVTGQTTLTSVESYFERKYNIQLQHPHVPLLVCREGKFPMELCFTPHGERYKEALQGQVTADFIKWATSPAYIRVQQIMDNIKRFHWHTLAIPASMGLSVKTSMLTLRGRLLPCPVPVYGSGSDKRGPESGAWNLRGKTFLKPAKIKSWGILYLPGGRYVVQDHEIHSFCRAISNSFSTVGLDRPSAAPAYLKGNPQGDIKAQIELLIGKTGNMFRAKPEMLFFLLHDKASPSIYKTIKSVCEVDFGIPSQVMLVEKALKSQGQMQYLGNIALKVNCKLGGTNSMIKEPLFRRSRFMMLGGDSSHPSPGELRKMPPPPSYCALVATYDQACVAYTAIATAQPATVELIGTFKPMVTELLKRYWERNDNLPESIIYWRDGISESQVPAFFKAEVKDLRSAFMEIDKTVKITVINCVKRHHTRLFPKSEKGDKLGNVLPGTVVESGNQDIFLVSQSALQGTVRPCHYKVLLDENDLSSDDFERLALNGTFSYGRATRSVGIHPAVYYADQVAERAKMHLRSEGGETVLKDTHDDLKYTMYWQ